ncbi:hypothetical protein AYK26_06085 [Euryarchaeota archaeon SM23-78]|nr:MAG: hypothetical protein AYK26_06085 [Euryarchaeota archaeon SM23-78]
MSYNLKLFYFELYYDLSLAMQSTSGWLHLYERNDSQHLNFLSKTRFDLPLLNKVFNENDFLTGEEKGVIEGQLEETINKAILKTKHGKRKRKRLFYEAQRLRSGKSTLDEFLNIHGIYNPNKEEEKK